jgi:hypothetical protein
MSVARVGRNTDGSGQFRSFFVFPLAAVHGRHILGATFRTRLVHSWSCAATPVSLYWAADVTTHGKVGWSPALLQHLHERWGNAHKGGGCTDQPDQGMEFSGALPARVQWAADTHKDSITLALSARRPDGSGESTQSWWKKFAPAATVLSVEYNTVPQQPAELSAGPGAACASGDARPFLGTATPTMTALLRDDDEGQVLQAGFEIAPAPDARPVWSAQAGPVPRNTVAQAAVPPGALADGATYAWRVRSGDGIDSSAPSAWCELTVDTTAPAAPPEVSSADFPEGEQGGTAGEPGTVTFAAAGVADVDGYVYGLNEDPPSTTVAVSTLGGPATVTMVPDRAGPNRLLVRSRDRAGNLGPIRTYLFFVSSEATS